MRAGDFSEVAAAYPAFRLYNPFTGGAGGVGRELFSNNQIPAGMLNADRAEGAGRLADAQHDRRRQLATASSTTS